MLSQRRWIDIVRDLVVETVTTSRPRSSLMYSPLYLSQASTLSLQSSIRPPSLIVEQADEEGTATA
eukprot:scaffold160806_cov15-Prasinocladus_malaysianus.AAC.1